MKYFLFFMTLFPLACRTPISDSNSLEQANKFAKNGLLREAVESYKKASHADPSNHIIQYRLGVVLLKVGNYVSAIRQLEKTLPAHHLHFKTNYYLAEAHRVSRKFAKATYYYQRALSIEPNNLMALRGLAWNFYKTKYYSEAFKSASKLYQQYPKDEQGRIILLKTLIKLNKLDKAFQVLKKYKWSPEHIATIRSIKGDLLFEKKQFKKAKSYYKKALKEKPLLSHALFGLGKYYLQTKEYPKAIERIEQGLRIRPHRLSAYLDLAKAYEASNYKKSLKYYKQFYKKAESDPEFLGLIPLVQKKIMYLTKRLK